VLSPRAFAAAAIVLASACDRPAPRAVHPPPPPPPVVHAPADAPGCRDAPALVMETRPGPGDHVLLGVSADSTGMRGTVNGLLAVRRDGGVALVTREAGRPPESDPFARWGVRAGATFTLLAWGRPVGSARVDSMRAYGGGVSTFTFHDAAPGQAAALATDLPAAAGPPLVRAPTGGERRAMVALLRDTVAAHGNGWAYVRPRDLHVDAVALPGGGVALVGSALERNEIDPIERPRMTVLIVAEREGARLRVAYARYEAEDDPYSPGLLDVVDLDGDGVPELVTVDDITQGGGMIGVFRRGPGGWREVARTGC